MGIFTREKSNFAYQKELDLAKGLAIIFMVLVHTNEYYQSLSIEGGFYNRVVEFLGSPPAAPIFMIILGAGIVYSKRSNPKYLFRRGVSLLAMGYMLSVFSDVIPGAILAHKFNDMSYLTEGIEYLGGFDILHFSGLAFIFFAFVKRFNICNKKLFVIWCGLATLNMFIRGNPVENETLNIICRGLWGTDDFSWFPFLSWIIFPIVGYYFGQLLIRCTDKKTLYKNLFIITAPLSVPLWIYSYINNVRFGAFGNLWQTEYYHHDILGNIVLCVFALFWISVLYFVAQYLPQGVNKAMSRWSKNTNSIYCIHYSLLGFTTIVLEQESYGPGMVIVIAICVFVVTDFLSVAYKKVKSRGLLKDSNPDDRLVLD